MKWGRQRKNSVNNTEYSKRKEKAWDFSSADLITDQGQK